jgi:hypothetical protein
MRIVFSIQWLQQFQKRGIVPVEFFIANPMTAPASGFLFMTGLEPLMLLFLHFIAISSKAKFAAAKMRLCSRINHIVVAIPIHNRMTYRREIL